jgi:hypothetical protein
VLIGLQLHEGDASATRRQQHAVEALGRLSGVDCLNVQFRNRRPVTHSEIETAALLTRDSTSFTAANGRPKPLTLEMFDVLARTAARRGRRFFAYINSDIIVTPAALAAVRARGCQTHAISRSDVDHVDGDTAVRPPLTAGVDMFVVDVDWWKRHRHRFRPYVIGDACWDNVYTAIMMCHSDGAILNREPLILHERHPVAWNAATPTAHYNGFLAALDARYFSLWATYWYRLEHARTHGPIDEEALRREVFVWRRSVWAAMHQAGRNARAWMRYRRQRSPSTAESAQSG